MRSTANIMQTVQLNHWLLLVAEDINVAVYLKAQKINLQSPSHHSVVITPN